MKDTEKTELITSIHKLQLSVFIDYCVDGIDCGIIISGNPAKGELDAAWTDIMQQYEDAIGGIQRGIRKNLIKEVISQRTKLYQVNLLVSILSKYYVKRFVEHLNSLLNSNLPFDPNKPDEYDKSLSRALNRAKSLKINIEISEKKLNTKIDISDYKKPTREHFDSILITLSDLAKYDINDQNITVYKFCERIKRINQKQKQ